MRVAARALLIYAVLSSVIVVVILNLCTNWELYLPSKDLLPSKNTISGPLDLEKASEFLKWKEKFVVFNESILSLRFHVSNPHKQPVLLCPIYLKNNPVVYIAWKIWQGVRDSRHQKGKMPGKSNLDALKRIYSSVWDHDGYIREKNMSKNEKTNAGLWKTMRNWPMMDSLDGLNIGDFLKLAATAKVLSADAERKGSQMKVKLLLEGEQTAYFKPKKYNVSDLIYGLPYSGSDRHNGEIVSFFLNQLLEYNAVPIVVKRKLRLNSEIMQVASPQLYQTFTNTSNGTACFYGVCRFCEKKTLVCEDRWGHLEGALVLKLSTRIKSVYSPWSRPYRKRKYNSWQQNINYCDNQSFKESSIKKRIQKILDMVSVSIFDFLIGNADRHHYELSIDLDMSSHTRKILLIDNAKSFGNPFEDYLDILAPLYQCCRIRKSLLSVLKSYKNWLGEALQELLGDQWKTLLHPNHFHALNRRLNIVLSAVDFCIENKRVYLEQLMDSDKPEQCSGCKLNNVLTKLKGSQSRLHQFL